MSARFAILGAGPAGCAAATFLARAGEDVLLIDQHREPPAAVGESLLPYGQRVLEKLNISTEGFQRKQGAVFTWASGEAVRFHFQSCDFRWKTAWQVPRDVFDARLRAAAVEAGARIHIARVDGVTLPGRIHTSTGTLTAEYIIDASGRRRLIARQLGTVTPHPDLKNAALYTTFRGVQRFDPEVEGDVTINAFDGGWFWFIPFLDGRTSVGLVMTPGAGLRGDRWAEALSRCPQAAERLSGATRLQRLQGAQNFTAYADRFHGPGYALIGDAAFFLDPVFSSGVLFAFESAETLTHTLLTGGDLDAWEAHLRRAARPMERAILGFYSGQFRDLACCPPDLIPPRYRTGLLSLLSGDLFSDNTMPHRVARQLDQIAARAARSR